jgi:hypothetical protein
MIVRNELGEPELREKDYDCGLDKQFFARNQHLLSDDYEYEGYDE